jgi:hypothetical protein
MNIEVFGMKFNLEILILIGIIYLILVVNTFCSCSNVPQMIETFKDVKNAIF